MGGAVPLLGGAVLGAIQGNEERKQTDRFNKGAAEANRFADVTGNRTALRQDKSGGLFGGAIKGASAFGGLGALGGAPAPTGPAVPGVQAANLNSAGGFRQPGGGGTFGGLGGGNFALS